MSSRSLNVNVDVLLIDLDGTLVDSHASIVRAWDRWSRRHGVEAEVVRNLMPGRTATSVMQAVGPHLTAEMIVREADEMMSWQVDDIDDVNACPGAETLLVQVPPERWAVVTACNERLARARLVAAGLPLPTILIGCEVAPAGKPDPTGYLIAAERFGVAPKRCLVIEDSPAGVPAGRAAGMTVLVVQTVAGQLVNGGDVYAGSLEKLEVKGPCNDGSLVVRQLS